MQYYRQEVCCRDVVLMVWLGFPSAVIKQNSCLGFQKCLKVGGLLLLSRQWVIWCPTTVRVICHGGHPPTDDVSCMLYVVAVYICHCSQTVAIVHAAVYEHHLSTEAASSMALIIMLQGTVFNWATNTLFFWICCAACDTLTSMFDCILLFNNFSVFLM